MRSARSTTGCGKRDVDGARALQGRIRSAAAEERKFLEKLKLVKLEVFDDSPTPDATLDGSVAAVRDRSNRERARIESAAMRKRGVGEHYSARPLTPAGSAKRASER